MQNKKNCWGFLDSGFNEGGYNMAVDEVLLNQAVAKIQKYPVLRIYGFYRKTVTLGYGQKIKELVGLDGYKKEGYEICRRITGGGAVFHGQDLTYSLVVPLEEYPEFSTPSKSYRLIHTAIAAGLRARGIKATLSTRGSDSPGALCFNSPVRDDVVCETRKLAGAAQKRAADYMLHQGSVDLSILKKPKDDFFDVFDDAKSAVLEGFKRTFNLDFVLIDLSLKELEEVVKLAKEKYQAFSWNFRC